jgi:nucleoside-diphosphate-sugar epimerase
MAMPAIPKRSLVLVTGVNGYIGSHIAEQLLEHVYRVRGTVRDAYKADYMHALFGKKYGEDAFEVQIVRDMATDGAFDEAMKGQAVSNRILLMRYHAKTL